jgi:hypothetical protein
VSDRQADKHNSNENVTSLCSPLRTAGENLKVTCTGVKSATVVGKVEGDTQSLITEKKKGEMVFKHQMIFIFTKRVFIKIALMAFF